MSEDVWQQCLYRMQDELPVQQFNTWIKPLKPSYEPGLIVLIAPNRFVKNWVTEKYLNQMQELAGYLGDGMSVQVVESHRPMAAPVMSSVETSRPVSVPEVQTEPVEMEAISGEFIESIRAVDEFEEPEEIIDAPEKSSPKLSGLAGNPVANQSSIEKPVLNEPQHQTYLSANYMFDTFVEGKSNQLALAAAQQVAENAGGAYNPLFIYGGVGLGKTHLMQAVGHEIMKKNPAAKVMYLPSETFVQDMVKALQRNAIAEFKRFYRSLDALLIDDIQFFAGKDRSQEEFFHTFNALLEGDQQVILTSDRFPKEIDGVEERLRSRFSWGLTVAVEPPELETRVAILMKKAEESGIHLPQDAAFFMANLVRSNVRELEGALKRVIASAHFTGSRISVQFVKESLRDLLDLQKKQVSIENIQRTVAEYYKIKVADLYSKRRSRSVARPRQLAMALAKELTNHSLPEIGDSFGGRDHTTVLHACKKIKELRETSLDIREDYDNLLRTLTT